MICGVGGRDQRTLYETSGEEARSAVDGANTPVLEHDEGGAGRHATRATAVGQYDGRASSVQTTSSQWMSRGPQRTVPNMRFSSIWFGWSLANAQAVHFGARSPNQQEAGEEGAIRSHKKRADGTDFVRRSGASDRAEVDHAAVALAAWPAQFILGQRRDDDAGADRVDAGAALAPPHGLGHDPQGIAALGKLVGVRLPC